MGTVVGVVQNAAMADVEVHHGLEGVVAFETQIAEPDKEGSALRYRGVDIEDIVGRVPFENVWGLLVDGALEPGLPPAEPFPVPVHSGDIRVDVQSALAMLAPFWGLQQLLDIDDEQAREDLARCSVVALSFVAQSARGLGLPAAYVSGYLRTIPPAGQPRLQGADASHAWVSVWCGTELGWIGFDPTNDLLVENDHIILAVARDFSDVSPVDGIIVGSRKQKLSVAVDVLLVE